MMKVTDKQISYNIIMILYALNINDTVSVSVCMCVCMCVCVGWGVGGPTAQRCMHGCFALL